MDYDPESPFVEYTVFTAERIWWIAIRCRESIDKRQTEAEICYTYIGLSETGNKRNRHAMAAMFSQDLKDWEQQMNYFLETGHQKTHS